MQVMFCPVCKVEYRSGFSRCADCDADLVEELPTEPTEKNTDISIADKGPAQDSFERLRTKSLTKSVLTFGLYQFIGMYGIPFTAPIVFSLGFKFLLLLGHSYPRKTFYSIVSESPYFPIQIIFAVILGWLLGRVFRLRSMAWIWVLPLAILCYSVAARVLNPDRSNRNGVAYREPRILFLVFAREECVPRASSSHQTRTDGCDEYVLLR